MARPMLQHLSHVHCASQLPLAIALFVSVTALVALCARHATKRRSIGADLVPKSKHLAATISSKAITLIHKKGGAGGGGRRRESGVGSKEADVDGGLWQKAILMGEKCQPLEFSGVIYYDNNGNQLAEPPVPRSPRATPLHALSIPAAARN